MYIVSTGTLPPPVGGVTIFLKYFSEALKELPYVKHEFFSFKRIFKYSNAVLHINASNRLKVFLFSLTGKLFFKKVFIVKHGNLFELKSFFVKASLFLADGVFCLNDQVQLQLETLNLRTFKHTTIFAENLAPIHPKIKKNGVSKVLYYINNSSSVDGKLTYGADFILSCLKKNLINFELVVVDLSGKYKQCFSVFPNVVYYSEALNFIDLLNDVDIYIRPTRTDGMSVALLEAGLLGVKCLASDVSERPSFAHTYKLDNIDDFIKQLEYVSTENTTAVKVELTSIKDVLSFF
jgi:hypothetical protein